MLLLLTGPKSVSPVLLITLNCELRMTTIESGPAAMLLSDVEPPLRPLSKLIAAGIAARGPNVVCSTVPLSGIPGCAPALADSISLPSLRPTSTLGAWTSGCGASPRKASDRSWIAVETIARDCSTWRTTGADGEEG